MRLHLTVGLFTVATLVTTITKSQGQTHAGTIAPGAVQMDVDYMTKFFAGYAVVKKGPGSALINEKGEIVVPYNTLEFLSYIDDIGVTLYPKNDYGFLMRFRHDLPLVSAIPFKEIATGKEGYINAAGQKVYRTSSFYKDNPLFVNTRYAAWLTAYDEEGYKNFYDYEGLFKDDGLLISERYDGSYIKGKGNYQRSAKPTEAPKRINYALLGYGWASDNHSVPALRATSQWTNGLRPAAYLNTSNAAPENDPAKILEKENNQAGFINRKGEFRIKPAYYSVGEFSEGISFVSKKDQFGKLSWGAIDTTGKLVIPYKYRLHPGRFSYGLAIVKALDVPGIDYAFINKKGETVFTIPKNSGDTSSISLTDVNDFNEYMYTFDYFHFVEGVQFVTISFKQGSGKESGMYLLDTSGKYTPIQQRLLAQLPSKGQVSIIPEIKDGKFIFRYARALYADGYANEAAEVNAFGMADIKGNILIPPLFYRLSLFDVGSNLQYAQLGKTSKYTDLRTEGYIDRTGVFKIVKVKAKGGF